MFPKGGGGASLILLHKFAPYDVIKGTCSCHLLRRLRRWQNQKSFVLVLA